MKEELETERRQPVAEQPIVGRVEGAHGVRSARLRPETKTVTLADLSQDGNVSRRQRLEMAHDDDCVIVTYGDLELGNCTSDAQTINGAPQDP